MYPLIALILKHTQLYTTLKRKTRSRTINHYQDSGNLGNCKKCGKKVFMLPINGLCKECASLESVKERYPDGYDPSKFTLDKAISSAILWQKDENPLGVVNCTLCEGVGTQQFQANKGYLVLSNQRLVFVSMQGSLLSLTHSFNLEDIIAVTPIGNKQLEVVDRENIRREFVQMPSQQIIELIKSSVIERKNQLLLASKKENIQIVLDFSSLKDVMAKGGLVMTTYKCPNCNGMVNIPEAGKVVVCQYCGTPIKPVDIFEKIKLLLQ
jgi:hypothetical protein